MAKLTQEQADRLKEIVNKDANLVKRYLEVKGLSQMDKHLWEYEWLKVNPKPSNYEDIWEWEDKRDDDWLEYVNTKLLPENVTGACVVGGIYLALCTIKPEGKELLPKLFRDNEMNVFEVNHEIIDLITDEFGLTEDMLVSIQQINDKTAETELRRKKICVRLDSFVILEDDAEEEEYEAREKDLV